MEDHGSLGSLATLQELSLADTGLTHGVRREVTIVEVPTGAWPVKVPLAPIAVGICCVLTSTASTAISASLERTISLIVASALAWPGVIPATAITGSVSSGSGVGACSMLSQLEVHHGLLRGNCTEVQTGRGSLVLASAAHDVGLEVVVIVCTAA